MPRLGRSLVLGFLAALLALVWFPVLPSTAQAQIDPARSYYVPEAGPVGAPIVGMNAVRLMRGCPNNDGSSWPNSVRIRIHLESAAGPPLAGVPAASIYAKFNGGGPLNCVPPPPGLPGADEIIANGVINVVPACPLVQFLTADGPTDAAGDAYITFAGALPGAPGVAVRDPLRKWGHYDDVPVYVVDPVTGVETPILGRLITAAPAGGYVLQLKNVDTSGGMTCVLNQGEAVTTVDFNSFVVKLGKPAQGINFWWDFDWSGVINPTDYNMLIGHLNHNCGFPLNP